MSLESRCPVTEEFSEMFDKDFKHDSEVWNMHIKNLDDKSWFKTRPLSEEQVNKEIERLKNYS